MLKIRIILIVVFVSLMIMGVGYAMWSQTITMNVGGTLATFEVKTIDAYVVDNSGQRTSSSEYASAEITDQGKVVSLIANKLIPSDSREFKIVFKNVGDCPAVLNRVDVMRKSGDGILNFILVCVDGGSWVRMDSAHSLAMTKAVDPGDSTSITVKIMLDQNAENTTVEQPFSLTIVPFFTQH